jgi:hypothetical protein
MRRRRSRVLSVSRLSQIAMSIKWGHTDVCVCI